ncbi:hypothetical protein GCM10011575_08080 [Microlunatus endophyticus]|uniref:Uncharacterized protein n=2 Tax=Microlunatus endophyticus TaxID=1716077 RepID=A0A917S258_9ACTN|nr:hypothetical protein GCM10011575_08080 [Microlunatus endophyticus]
MIWGATLLLAGPELFRRLEGRVPDQAEQLGIGVLGARYLTQGGLEALAPGRFARLHTVVEMVHASSMLLLAVRQPSRRRIAVVSGAQAALAGWRAWRCR